MNKDFMMFSSSIKTNVLALIVQSLSFELLSFESFRIKVMEQEILRVFKVTLKLL